MNGNVYGVKERTVAQRLIRTGNGSVVAYGLCCRHLSMDTDLGYYAVFRPGEEQADYFCKHCFSRLSKNETIAVERCCPCCVSQILASHRLLYELEMELP